MSILSAEPSRAEPVSGSEPATLAVWDLSNPSDKVTFEAATLRTAAVVAFLLGGGQYGAEEIGGDRRVPIFLFGGSAEWCEAQFGQTVEAVFEAEKAYATTLAAALRSCLYASAKDRPFAKPDRDAWNDAHRSSMNNIIGRADSWAERLASPTQAEQVRG